MKFYGSNYLQTQSNLNDYLKYIIIFSTLFILIAVFSLYICHRLQTKYRDLTIIAFCFCFLFRAFSMRVIQTTKIYIQNNRKCSVLSGSYQEKKCKHRLYLFQLSAIVGWYDR